MHLILAIFWLICGVLWIAWDAVHPEPSSFHLPGTNLSAGWAALLFSVYNALRWWSARAAVRQRDLRRQARPPRLGGRQQQQASPGELNPDFDFDDLKKTDRKRHEG